MSEAQLLLGEYVENRSETAFRELVNRYVDLVYSAALRLVNGDTHLAHDVTQTVFADLARLAPSLSREVMLGGWLHRHTIFVASKTIRGERRRANREKQAVEMNSMDDPDNGDLAEVAPMLDAAIDELAPEDRRAVLLRFFERKDYRSVGEALGTSEDAARKRVDRALQQLQGMLTRRGATLSAAALSAALGTGAVIAAPTGLAAVIAASALATPALTGITTATIIGIMNTKAKVAVITALLAAMAVPVVLQYRTQTVLQAENETLSSQAARVAELEKENRRLTTQLARVNSARAAALPEEQNLELQRLRAEVSRLRQESRIASATPKPPGPSPLSGLTANPEMQMLIRKQQKTGMSMIYKNFAKTANLSPENAEKFYDLLADGIMENIENVSTVLKEGKSAEERDQLFAQHERSMEERVKTLLGEEAAGQYRDFTQNLASDLTGVQFRERLTGDENSKNERSKAMAQMMKEETKIALANAGLPEDYQVVPILNFRNIASAEQGEKSIQLLDSIYERLNSRVAPIFSQEELEKFQNFRKEAIENSRAALQVNRKMMAPSQQQ